MFHAIRGTPSIPSPRQKSPSRPVGAVTEALRVRATLIRDRKRTRPQWKKSSTYHLRGNIAWNVRPARGVARVRGRMRRRLRLGGPDRFCFYRKAIKRIRLHRIRDLSLLLQASR